MASKRAPRHSGSSPAFVVAVATALPGTSTHEHLGRTAVRVGDHELVSVGAGGDVRVLLHGPDEAVAELHVHQVGRDELRRMIEDAWAEVAPKRSVTAFAKRRAAWEACAPITHDEVRQLVLSLPGANEGPIWGKDVGFRVGDDKQGRFARWGPPDGGGISRLGPPDDLDTLVILRCPVRPALLADRPDRFFTTEHYGDPDEPGGVIARLAEFRDRADRDLLADVLEESWRDACLAMGLPT